MTLTEAEIELLLRQGSISTDWPWATNDEATIDGFIKETVAEVCRKLRLSHKTDYDHYGSGYASYVDCWMYRPHEEFRVGEHNHFMGLVVLFSRLSPFYVLGQGDKSWADGSSASYLPCFEFVDVLDHAAVAKLVPGVTEILDSRGLIRLHRSEVDSLLPKGTRVPTILVDRAFRHFDALFYWED